MTFKVSRKHISVYQALFLRTWYQARSVAIAVGISYLKCIEVVHTSDYHWTTVCMYVCMYVFTGMYLHKGSQQVGWNSFSIKKRF